MIKKIPETHLKYDPETGNIFGGTTIIGNLDDPDETFVCRNEITADDVTVGDIKAMIRWWKPVTVISEKAHEGIRAALKQVEGFDASTYPYAEEQKVGPKWLKGKKPSNPYFDTAAHIKKTVGADAEIDRLNELLAAAQNRIKELENELKHGGTRTEHEDNKVEHEEEKVEHEDNKVEHEPRGTGKKNSRFKGKVLVANMRYGSLTEASAQTGIPKSTISRRIKKNLPGYGYL